MVVQLGDAATTYHIVHRGGRELNPLLRGLIQRLGLVPALLLTKIIILAATAYADHRYALGWGVYAPLIALQLSAVAFNLRSMR